ncbi:general stress protein [Virgibacillus ihumii]|uniref:general stress protein n=1 Tax=Virgibacillus ihumii TaxID=2686091 RepID=UPI00157BB6A1|nr:general stress protein [Virgibacillus ihumii]
MANEVYGPYGSEEEAIKAVDIMALKGLKAENITILANRKMSKQMEKWTDANVESSAEDDSKSSVFSKIKGIFTDEEETEVNFRDRLIELGLSETQAEKFEKIIESGQIIILASDELRMGHDAAGETVSMQEPIYLQKG